MKTTSG